MKSNFEDVGEFHRRFDIPRAIPGNTVPAIPAPDVIEFRTKFLHEELREYDDAVAKNDLPGAADALVDLVYVALGTAHLFGLPWQDLWDEVQSANMRKVRGDAATSKRGHALDVVKPKGWQSPDVSGILLAHGWKGELVPRSEAHTRTILALRRNPDVFVMLFDRPPCFMCGYNGAGYKQPDTHSCAADYHSMLERVGCR